MNSTICNFKSSLLVLIPLLFSLSGCGGSGGPSMGQVNGNITFDGKPLAGATVTFEPESGSPSKGLTDPDGNYELQYSPQMAGAEPGKHKVVIRTATDSAGKEALPAKYHDATELTAEVVKGPNIINFDLTK
ncbi:MAG: carboxypeptidase regulatory-like domain-containing protein [Planctomycetaceae bacterium]|nr:carboxypeptidase regulatory-like domain-containing protein [Planctomycetaceae bacterium]